MRRFAQKIIPRLFDSLVLMCCCFYTADNADKQNFIVFKPQPLGEEKSLAPVNESMSQQLCADDFETLWLLSSNCPYGQSDGTHVQTGCRHDCICVL